MSDIGWTILAICFLLVGACFFAINAIALRTFSSAKLYEAFKELRKDATADKLIESSEKLTLVCSLYRLVLNVFIILLLLSIFSADKSHPLTFTDYILVFIISIAIFSILGLAIPHAWAKYAGEKTLCRTYRLLQFCAIIAWPILYIFQLYDELIKRLAGITEATEEERQEEKEEEFLTDLEQQKLEGVVDEEEQAMIENVLELTDTTTGEILTPRTDVIAIEANSDLSTILEIITRAGHSRYPVYEETIDKIIGFIYAKDLLAEIGNNAEHFRLSEKMRQAYFVPETKPLRELLHEFRRNILGTPEEEERGDRQIGPLPGALDKYWDDLQTRPEYRRRLASAGITPVPLQSDDFIFDKLIVEKTKELVAYNLSRQRLPVSGSHTRGRDYFQLYIDATYDPRAYPHSAHCEFQKTSFLYAK